MVFIMGVSTVSSSFFTFGIVDLLTAGWACFSCVFAVAVAIGIVDCIFEGKGKTTSVMIKGSSTGDYQDFTQSRIMGKKIKKTKMMTPIRMPIIMDFSYRRLKK